jgi:hypothetical protein
MNFYRPFCLAENTAFLLNCHLIFPAINEQHTADDWRNLYKVLIVVLAGLLPNADEDATIVNFFVLCMDRYMLLARSESFTAHSLIKLEKLTIEVNPGHDYWSTAFL